MDLFVGYPLNIERRLAVSPSIFTSGNLQFDLPASTFERSSISLIRFNRSVPELWIFLAYSASFSPIGSAPVLGQHCASIRMLLAESWVHATYWRGIPTYIYWSIPIPGPWSPPPSLASPGVFLVLPVDWLSSSSSLVVAALSVGSSNSDSDLSSNSGFACSLNLTASILPAGLPVLRTGVGFLPGAPLFFPGPGRVMQWQYYRYELQYCRWQHGKITGCCPIQSRLSQISKRKGTAMIFFGSLLWNWYRYWNTSGISPIKIVFFRLGLSHQPSPNGWPGSHFSFIDGIGGYQLQMSVIFLR